MHFKIYFLINDIAIDSKIHKIVTENVSLKCGLSIFN